MAPEDAKPPAATASAEAAATAFYDGAYPRIVKFMAVLAALAIPVVWAVFGLRVAVPFAAGCLLAFLSTHWQKQTVETLCDGITRPEQRTRTGVVVRRFLLRYLLVGVGAYVIFKSSAFNVYGLLVGLSLPVAAITCEAAYETYVAIRRGI